MDTAQGWGDFEFVAQSGKDTGNDELEDFAPQQVQQRGAALHLVLQRASGRYVSGKIRSRRSLSEMAPDGGVLEVTIQGPSSRARGMWPAVWLLPTAPWPTGGEIDLLELMAFAGNEQHAFSTLHFGPWAGRDAVWPGHWGLSLGSYPWDDREHTLRFEWSRGWTASLAVDGRRIWSFTTTRNDVFMGIEHNSLQHAEQYAPGRPGDPAAIFARAFESKDFGLHLIINLSFGGKPFRTVDHSFQQSELIVKRVTLTPH